mmetsp:Transcript_1423/g.2998  ORF Transcript_1423/g.2998 Transcript_1423/m.2998 type:complete len:102 (-) Transcript_1423:193-498(-)
MQYALFRMSDLLVGVHGGAFGWAPFLSPSQAVVEIPLPNSPGLHHWSFLMMGARSKVAMACSKVPRSWETLPSSQLIGCPSSSGGNANVTSVLAAVRSVLL